MKLIAAYQALIESTGRKVDENENIYTVNDNNDKRAIVKLGLDGRNLPLRLPTTAVRKEQHQDTYIGFHPLSESHIRGESVVAAWLRRTICQSITLKAIPLVIELLEASFGDNVRSSADPALLPLLTAVKSADETTLTKIIKAVQRVDNERYTLCNIYTKRDGEIDGETYDRACIVRFPIPMDDPKNLFGVTMRTGKIKDLVILKNLLDTVLPGWETDAYCRGSNSNEAPYFCALLESYLAIANAINTCVDNYKGILEDPDEYRTDTSWSYLLENISDYMDEIPIMAGNIGSQGKKEEKPKVNRHITLPDVTASAVENPVTTQAPTPQPTLQPAPSQSTVNPTVPTRPQPQPAQPSSSGGQLTYAEMERLTQGNQPVHSHVPTAQPQQSPAQQPVFVGYDANNQPVYQQPAQAASQQPVFVGYDANNQPVYQQPTQPQQQPAQQPVFVGYDANNQPVYQQSAQPAQQQYPPNGFHPPQQQNGFNPPAQQQAMSARDRAEAGYNNGNNNGYW